MAVPKNKQIALKTGEACQITLPDGRMLEISSAGKIDLTATNGDAVVFRIPDIERGKTDIEPISSLINGQLTKHQP